MRRILSLILAFCLVLGCMQLPAFADAQEASEAAQTLEALGIIEGFGGDLMLEKVLTRAEFVTMLMRAMNITSFGNAVYFEDVDASHWANGAIGAACGMGIVSGYNSREFHPDDPVAYEEAVKMLVAALGYQPLAIAKGGYPSGYMYVAQSVDLLDNTDGESGLILNRSIASELVFNALNANKFVETSFGDGITGEAVPGVTLLSDNLDIEKGTGIIKSTDVSSLVDASGAPKGTVRIGDRIFNTGETSASELLGYSVTYYADMPESGVPTLIYVRVDEKGNDVTEINAEDVSSATTVRALKYSSADSGKVKTVKISPYAYLIYNGVSVSAFDENDLQPSSGALTLIDNNGDGEADVILVYEYETIIAGSILPSEYAVYDYEDTSKYVKLNPNDDEYECIIYKNGKTIEFAEIQKDSILSVAESTVSGKRRKITVYYSEETVSGVLESVSEKSVKINGDEYPIDKGLKSKLSKYIGQDITAYVDAFGSIADISKEVKSPFEYGYLIKGGMEKGLGGKYKLKVLTASGAIKIFDAAEKITLDGKPGVASDTLAALLAATVRDGGSDIEQVIRYRTNSKGEIFAIDTEGADSGNDDDLLCEDFPKTTEYAGGRRFYYDQFGYSNLDFMINTDTVVFCIPDATHKEDDEYYSAVGKSYFTNASYYNAAGYDVSDTYVAGVVLVERPADSSLLIPDGDRPILVTSVSKVLKDDEIMYQITGYQLGKSINLYTQNKALITNGTHMIAPGDVVKFVTNSFGEIAQITWFFHSGSLAKDGFKQNSGSNSGYYWATYVLAYGYATAKNGAELVVETNPNGADNKITPMLLASNTRYFIYNDRTGEMTLATESDLDNYLYSRNPNCKVLAIIRGMGPDDVIIYDYS